MDTKAMYKLGYGLYVLTSQHYGYHNGCIINTAIQVTTTPNRISITVNKSNLTHDMIINTGEFNLSVLTEDASFDLFKHFGFQSGSEANKLRGYPNAAMSANGLYYITESTNAYISAKVVHTFDLGTHTMFIADVTDAVILSDRPSVTYAYYQDHIKPRPAAPAPSPEAKTTKWVCRICGYIYEGEELPADFICPICKHGAIDFEKLE
ncbi:MAG: flavin reductase [Firmicutes bacterium]|nr:flavin reductase [Bacillota bacterium]